MNEQPVTIRVVTTFSEAYHLLTEARQRFDTVLPPQVQKRIQELFGKALTAEEIVTQIIHDVRREGDTALVRYTHLLDGVQLKSLEVTPEEFAAARQRVAPDIRAALEAAAARIRAFHAQQRSQTWLTFDGTGTFGQLVRPLERVGVYAPAGRAPYPSSLLMSAIPAQVAGVREIVICTPPLPDGSAHPLILTAAEIAGTHRVFKIGGAQAIAALAFGTATIPKVDKIVGPGNIFVVLAMRAVFGIVDIGLLPGPTETLLIADDSANPVLCAADLLAQAEHDPMASAILLTTSVDLAQQVVAEVQRQLPRLERAAIAREALERNGLIAVVPTLDDAFTLANAYAPEHLCLLVQDAWRYLDKVTHAGGVFLGEQSPEVIGDYVAGPSHVMPTGQTARFASPLNVETFLKRTSIIAVHESGLRSLGPTAITLARAEGLTAHAAAIEQRLERLRPD